MCWRRVPERRGGKVGWWGPEGPVGFPFSSHGAKVRNPKETGRIESSESFDMFITNIRQGSSSHLLVVLSLLQDLEAAVVWLTSDGHVRLLLQDVQAELVAAAQTLLHAQRQAGMLLRRRVIINTHRLALRI